MEHSTQTLDCSIVASVYNEEAGIQLFYNALSDTMRAMKIAYEIIFVNDGSSDGSLQFLQQFAQSDENVRVVDFSRNFGHEAAMLAGIDHARGSAIICMDSDLQHPPALIAEMLQKYREGFEVVNMVRSDRKDNSALQKMRSKLFYRFMNSISSVKLAENASDFFLVSRKIANILRVDFRERTRFLRGIIQLVGFRKTTISYIAPPRVAGESHYSFIKLLKLSFTAVSSFSNVPLRLGIFTGLVFIAVSVGLIVYSIVMWWLQRTVPGYTTLIIFMSAFAGIQLFITGLIGQYLSYIFDEIKGRPIYIVNEVYN
ncbi:MAG: glycosyltransferase family 2 protein [Bacteroidales bacterium]|jgi:dolichol-phosphate mannosyltransferase|nr:glycosyltransferase family 2 protein [Bacteroidales bacterium]